MIIAALCGLYKLTCLLTRVLFFTQAFWGFTRHRSGMTLKRLNKTFLGHLRLGCPSKCEIELLFFNWSYAFSIRTILSSTSPGYHRPRPTSSLISLERRHLRVDLVRAFNIIKGTHTCFCMGQTVFDEAAVLFCVRVMKYENRLPASLVISLSMSVCWAVNCLKSIPKDLWNFCSTSPIFFSFFIGIPALIVNRQN